MFWGGTMMIKELFNFEEIQQVIEIGNIKDESEMITKFVISNNLKDDLLEFLEYLKGNKPENTTSLNIIGNYGTGKSHLLTFLSLILSKPELIQHIQDDDLKIAFSNLNKEYLVVKYELPATKEKSLASIFFYRVKKQLKDNYNIEIEDIDYEKDPRDAKELVEDIILKIKETYPNKGLIVIFDEYSDFLKQKDAANQNYDLQFTRQLAESSINQDFILMLSMQEHIFSDPVYKDKADLINKIEKRFLKINITSENVEDIIAKRMVKKDSNQRQELSKLFEDLESKFDNIAIEKDRYINLFPVHPYLIEIFSKLPFYENRSILKFISQQTKKIMDEEFPSFITYDLIYGGLIESEHTIKNRPEVKPIIDVVKSLKDIINRLDSQYQNRALRLVKALAIKNLVATPDSKGIRIGGDTPEKFAENLFIIPNSRFIESSDDISTILKMIIQKSEGQFINHDNEKDVFFINLDATIDYEQIINNRANDMDDLQHINEVFVENFLVEELDLDVSSNSMHLPPEKKYILNDSFHWKERNSFRLGTLTINVGHKLDISDLNDYLITVKGYGENIDINEHHPLHIIIKPKFDDDFVFSIKRLAAVEDLLRTQTYPEIMTNKEKSIINYELKQKFNNAFINSTIVYKQKNYSIEELGINSDINVEIFNKIKEKLLGEDLINKYPKYPRFNVKLSKTNINGTIESVIKDVSSKTNVVRDLNHQSVKILFPLELYEDNMLNVNQSECANLILDKVEDSSKNIDINDFVKEFEKQPYGFQKEITYLIIAMLLRNGDIMISNNHGKIYSSAEFITLFKNGLKAFNELKYIKKEEGPNARTQLLFEALDLDGSLLQFKNNYNTAYQNYMVKINEIESNINVIKNFLNEIKESFDIGLPINDLEDKINSIDKLDFKSLEVNNINAFNKLDYTSEHLEDIKNNYNLINNFIWFIKDYREYIASDMKYMKNVMEVIDNNFFKEMDKEYLKEIYNNSFSIVNNINKLLKEDERRPLKGKIDLFKDKYKNIYYNAHEKYVGKEIDWQSLDDLDNSQIMKKLELLKNLNSINSTLLLDIKSPIFDLKSLRCLNFKIDELNDSTHCHCLFPDGNYNPEDNFNNQIEILRERIRKTFKILGKSDN